MKLLKRLNWGAIIRGLLFVSSLLVILDTVYRMLILPFFTLEPVTLTWFGTMVCLVATIILWNTFEYFEERLTNE